METFTENSSTMKKLLILSITLFSLQTKAQTAEKEKLKVYIDCDWCDVTFIKQELTYVSYVIDRLLSDVHIMLLSQNTGSGGDLHTILFFGQGDMKNYNDTLTLATDINQTSDEIRRALLKIMKLGLVSYMVKKGYTNQLSLNFSGTTEAVEEFDKWNKWIFSLSASGWFNGEEQYNSLNLYSDLSIDKITEDWKFRFNYGYNHNTSKYLLDDTWVISEIKNQWSDLEYIKSLSDHWSAGLFAGASSSLFDNYKLNTYGAPGIEYNLFPYEESTQRQFRFVYRVGARHIVYNDSTIYNVSKETLGQQSLGFAFSMKEKWGSISTSITGKHYFHDFNLNNLNMWTSLNLRLFKGFTLQLSGSFTIIHDQINLPLGNYSAEEVLLRQRQLQTGFRYWGRAGISYTFGSMYNSVVNPRFGQ